MKHARARFALAHHDGYLYAVGGMQKKHEFCLGRLFGKCRVF